MYLWNLRHQKVWQPCSIIQSNLPTSNFIWTYYYVPLKAYTAVIEHGSEISNLQSMPMFCPSSPQEIFVDQTLVVRNPMASISSTDILYPAAHSSYNFDELQYGGSSHYCTQDLKDLGSTLQQKDYTSLHQVQFNQDFETSLYSKEKGKKEKKMNCTLLNRLRTRNK